MVIHHLVVDGVSWRILVEDLQVGCEQVLAGRTIELSPKTTSFQRWAQRLQEYGQGPQVQEQLGYWQEVLQAPVLPLPRDSQCQNNAVEFLSVVRQELSVEETRALLQEVPE